MQRTNSAVDHSTEKARVFFALWPDQQLSSSLFRHARRMQRACGGRAMCRETLHLTLLFLQEIPRQRLPDLLKVATLVHEKYFTFCLEEFSCWRHNRIGYLAPKGPTAALEALVVAIRQHVAAAEFGFDDRAFSPHVTLLRNVTRPVERLPVPPLEWHAREFALVESVPDAAGRRYQVLNTWPLD